MAIIENELENERKSSQSQVDRAWEIYYQLRDKIETPKNIGKLIIIDTESGDYEIGDDLDFDVNDRLQARHPQSVLFALRIGYEAVGSFDGALERLP